MPADDVYQVLQQIFRTMLGHEVRRVAPDDGSWGATGKESLTACVTASGAWEGSLLLHCTKIAAADLALWFTQRDPETSEDVSDALGELANVAAGNIKVLFPSPTRISLPTVVEGEEYAVRVPGGHELCRVAFAVEPHVVQVALVERDEPPKA